MNKLPGKQKRPLSRAQQQKRQRREQLVGVLVGVLTPLFGVAILREYYPNVDVNNLEASTIKYLAVRLFTFAVIINAGMFFLTLKLNRESMSRGVLIGTLLIALTILYFKFIF